jgi:hypothetical protein
MTEQETAQDFARRLFGPRPEPEPKDEPEPINDATGPKEPKGEAHSPEAEPEPSTPEDRHQQFLGHLLGGAAKREVDQRLFGSGHPPTPKEDTSGSG